MHQDGLEPPHSVTMQSALPARYCVWWGETPSWHAWIFSGDKGVLRALAALKMNRIPGSTEAMKQGGLTSQVRSWTDTVWIIPCHQNGKTQSNLRAIILQRSKWQTSEPHPIFNKHQKGRINKPQTYIPLLYNTTNMTTMNPRTTIPSSWYQNDGITHPRSKFHSHLSQENETNKPTTLSNWD